MVKINYKIEEYGEKEFVKLRLEKDFDGDISVVATLPNGLTEHILGLTAEGNLVRFRDIDVDFGFELNNSGRITETNEKEK